MPKSVQSRTIAATIHANSIKYAIDPRKYDKNFKNGFLYIMKEERSSTKFSGYKIKFNI